MPFTTCSYCGKKFWKQPRQANLHKRHFCCREHYYKYRREYDYWKEGQDMTHYRKLKALAEERRERKLLNTPK